MKKILFFAAAAVAMLASCSQSDDLTAPTVAQNDQQQTAVEFGTYVGRQAQTRSGATGDIAATEDPYTATQVLAQKSGFGVFAYNTGASTWSTAGASTAPNFMYNQHVTGSNDATPTWTYTPIKYWPNGTDTGNAANDPSNTATQSGIQYLSFFAYGPYAELSGTDLTATGITAINGRATSGGAAGVGNQKQGDPTISYAFAANSANTITEQVDLLWGTRSATADYAEADGTPNDADATGAYKDAAGNYYNTDLTKQKNTETVDFNFKHALAKVGGKDRLKVVLDLDGNGDGETGSTVTAKEANTLVTIQSIQIQNVENKFIQSGVFNLATGTWTTADFATVAEGAALNLTFDRATNIAMNSAIVEPETAPTWSAGAWNMTGVTTTATDVYASSTGASIFLIPSTANAQQLKVTVTYIVRTQDGNLAVPEGESASCSKVTQTITNTVTIPTDLLKPNKRITLVLHLGLTSVKFGAEVANWEDVSGATAQEVWLPSNVVVTP